MTDPRITEPRNGSPAVGGLVPEGAVPAVRCQAHTSAGKPCKRWAIVGGFVCPTHGGSAPQVRAAANRRLLALAPRAVQVLADLMEHAESEPTRARAAIDLLDRVFGKAVVPTLDVTPHDDATGPSPLDLAIEAALRVRDLPVSSPPERPSRDDEVIDAEVVEPVLVDTVSVPMVPDASEPADTASTAG